MYSVIFLFLFLVTSATDAQSGSVGSVAHTEAATQTISEQGSLQCLAHARLCATGLELAFCIGQLWVCCW